MRALRFASLLLLALSALRPTRASAVVTFNVNSTEDHPDDIHDGVCADAFGKCTLRAAVMEANLGSSIDGFKIMLPAGTYTLSRAVTNPDDHSNGDLDVNNTIEIRGAGASATIIDASHVDRAFKVSESAYLLLYDLTIENGQPSSFGNRSTSGGAILTYGDLYVRGCVLDSNTSGGGGGAIEARRLNTYVPLVIVAKTTFSRNVAAGGGGGGFYGSATNGTFDACTFSGNSANEGGGVEQNFGTLNMQNTTLYQNHALDYGGGVYVYEASGGLFNMTLGGNSADSDLDGVGLGGGLYVSNTTLNLSNSMLANLNDFTQGNDDCYTYTGSVGLLGTNMLRSTDGCSFSGVGFAIQADPLLLLLKDNGGPTQTELPVPYSLTVNGGPSGGCVDRNGFPLTVDQRGVKRPIGSKCDLGATELEPIGDANGDGVVNVADVFYAINFLFAGGPPPLGRANVNGDAVVTVADVFYLINYLFAGGPAPI